METSFYGRIYTKKEISYCESKNNVKYQHYAARFAAKEAIFKAISKALKNKYEISWQNIEIINDEQGKPNVNFNEITIDGLIGCDVSISHCKEYATATAIAMYMEEK